MILPTAMRIQDDIPTVLGRKLAEFEASRDEINEVEKDLAISEFEDCKHDLPGLSSSSGNALIGFKPDADGWIPWDGGACPAPGKGATVRFRSGKKFTCEADFFDWGYLQVPCSLDVVAYL